MKKSLLAKAACVAAAALVSAGACALQTTSAEAYVMCAGAMIVARDAQSAAFDMERVETATGAGGAQTLTTAVHCEKRKDADGNLEMAQQTVMTPGEGGSPGGAGVQKSSLYYKEGMVYISFDDSADSRTKGKFAPDALLAQMLGNNVLPYSVKTVESIAKDSAGKTTVTFSIPADDVAGFVSAGFDDPLGLYGYAPSPGSPYPSIADKHEPGSVSAGSDASMVFEVAEDGTLIGMTAEYEYDVESPGAGKVSHSVREAYSNIVVGDVEIAFPSDLARY